MLKWEIKKNDGLSTEIIIDENGERIAVIAYPLVSLIVNEHNQMVDLHRRFLVVERWQDQEDMISKES